MTQPILLVPYMWVGDFVRCHTVVKLLNGRFPHRPVDVLATPLTALLADYMPGIRKTIVAELPRGRLALAKQWELARRLRRERYGTVVVMPRTWKSSLAPFLAGIPERTGFAGEGRFVPDQRSALGRAAARPHDRPLRGAGVAQERERAAANGLAAARTRRPRRRDRAVARAAQSPRRQLGRCARAGIGGVGAPLAGRALRRTRAAARGRRASKPGCWAVRTRRRSAARLRTPAARRRAISPESICATRFWPWLPSTPWCRTIPGFCMSPPRPAPRPSGCSVRVRLIYQRRSIRWRPSSRPGASSPAGRACSTCVPCSICAACVTITVEQVLDATRRTLEGGSLRLRG